MLDAIRWDAELIHRYDQTGPRYVCYPTPRQFNGSLGSFDLLHSLRRSRQASRPLSLYVHLPFCANVCYHCHRNKVVSSERGRASQYLQRLEREIEMVGCHLGTDQIVEQLHFGGGTPTYLGHDELRRLMAHLRKHFNLQDDDHGDFAIEVDPREADWPTMGLLRELGFNRVSIGVPDLDPAVQRAINRTQTLQQTQTIMEAARTLQFRSIRVDLAYGLPAQTTEGFGRTIEAVIAMQPDRVALSGYPHLPERHLAQRRIDPGVLPGFEDRLALLELGVEQLTRAGYRYIGMDHFALPDDELAMAQEDGTLKRNFQGYTTHGHCDLIGLGVSAISQIGDTYFQNDSDITLYQEALNKDQLATNRGFKCSEDHVIRRHVIQALICDFELRFAETEKHLRIEFKHYFADIWPDLTSMARDGLIQLSEDSLSILPAGRLLAHAICTLFDGNPASRPALQMCRAM